jgi:hypothetical protein
MMEMPVPPALWEAFVGEDQRWRKLMPLLPKYPTKIELS